MTGSHIDKLLARRRGQSIIYKGIEWYVKERVHWRITNSEKETQWTLTSPGRETIYLLCTEQRSGGGPLRQWVATSPISFADVYNPELPGRRGKINSGALPAAPFPHLGYNGQTFTLGRNYIVQAKDDEGNTVPKVTWDYYSADGKTNLAIEIWKEPDGNYPEIYLGQVIDPGMLGIPPRDRLVKRLSWSKETGQLVMYGLGIPFFLLLVGVPLDILLFIVPILILFIAAVSFYNHPGPVINSVIWVILSLLLLVTGREAHFWGVWLLCLLLVPLIPLIILRKSPDVARDKIGFFIWTGTFPVLWFYSFYLYFAHAPGPHDGSQLMAAILAPLLISGGCYAVNALWEKIWRSSN